MAASSAGLYSAATAAMARPKGANTLIPEPVEFGARQYPDDHTAPVIRVRFAGSESGPG